MRRLRLKIALSVGFLSVAIAALVAHANPATGYEISIYSMTPDLVWAGLTVAFVVSLFVALASTTHRDRGLRSVALVLGGTVATVFVGLPIVRGYHFYGQHDALTHLGWARAISEGTITPFDLFYPGIHTVTVVINSALGISLSRSMLFVVLLASLVFFAFVPLCVGAIVPKRLAVVVATFSAFLLLPITTISMYMSAHAMSQAVLFSALFVYLFAKYVDAGRDVTTVSAVGILFALVSIAIVTYHPQLAAHLIVVLLGIAAVQYLARRVASADRIAGQTPVYGQTLFLIAVFVLWISNHGFVSDTIAYFFISVVEVVFGDGMGAGSSVTTQGASLQAIGGSLIEIFFKLFFPQLVFTLLAGLLGLGALVHWNRLESVRAETTYFVAGLSGLGCLFVVYFLTPGSKMYFRAFGLVMLFVTILGSISLFVILTELRRRSSSAVGRSGHALFTVGFSFLVILSLAAVFPSPYIYNASPHVSEGAISGYETAFTNQDEDVGIVGLRGTANRYDDAVNGNADRMRLHESASETAFDDELTTYYESDRYLILTSADYQREQRAYRGLRYAQEDLRSITTEPRVYRVQSNGEFEMYYINSENSTA
ncbi:MFS transporter [Halosolutus halophilus]|uniref:MFS transporter n=1 Tax=Halosolutus halophilus TaxID=1552990 RepID=UPI002234FFEE|nr:MFS transporter [Halosolutus halophilus]